MGRGYHKGRGLTMAEAGLSLEDLQGDPLELLAREGAKMLLSVALEEEVTNFLGRDRYERSQGELQGYRNGHRERSVTIGSGEIEVKVPRVSQTAEGYRSQLIEAWQRRSRAVEEVIPLLYVEGLSTRDFRRALKPLWGDSGLSRSSVSRANRALQESFHAWRQRDLSEEDIVYVFLDGIYLGVRGKTREKEAVLVVHGIRRQGERVLLHLSLGGRESTEAWKAVLHDLVDRGLQAPQLLTSDGNAGLLRAIKEVWPEVAHQRCVVHRTWNVLARVPKRRQAEVKRALHRIFYAPCLEEAKEEARQFVTRYGEEFPTATEVLVSHLEGCLTFYRFPERHWKKIRSSNVLERTFKEVRRRTRVVGRFPTENSALMMIFGVLEEQRLRWQKARMRRQDIAWIEEAAKSLKEEPITLEFPELVLTA